MFGYLYRFNVVTELPIIFDTSIEYSSTWHHHNCAEMDSLGMRTCLRLSGPNEVNL